MLVDEITMTIKAGDGGDGLVSFRREKYIPKGGPWGGNGGIGGSVIFEGVDDIGILYKYRNKLLWAAENGQRGGPNLRSGLNGKDLILPVPQGTLITDLSTNQTLELTKRGQRITIAKGGIGGKGNKEFATATNQTPRYAEPGHPGEQKKLKLELRLIADIGFIGLPNAGKSSLLNALTNTEVKVGNYPFTTLEPNLGAMDGLILADIPGLIEGASHGKGLGHKFLRHIARTRVLVHTISTESDDPLKDYQIVRDEISRFDPAILEKEEIILLTKTDLTTEEELKKKKQKLPKKIKKIYTVSIYDEKSIQKLRKILQQNI